MQNNYGNAFREPMRHQQGMALIVSLVLLLALTIIGLTAARSASVEQRMTTNELDKQRAFQASEAALLATENGLLAGKWTNFQPVGSSSASAGLYALDTASPPTTPLWQTIDWTNTSNYLTYDGITGQSLPSVAVQPKIIIEQLPSTAAPGQSLTAPQYGAGTAQINVYRITVLGTGGDGDAQVMLQTTFHN